MKRLEEPYVSMSLKQILLILLRRGRIFLFWTVRMENFPLNRFRVFLMILRNQKTERIVIRRQRLGYPYPMRKKIPDGNPEQTVTPGNRILKQGQAETVRRRKPAQEIILLRQKNPTREATPLRRWNPARGMTTLREMKPTQRTVLLRQKNPQKQTEMRQQRIRRDKGEKNSR